MNAPTLHRAESAHTDTPSLASAITDGLRAQLRHHALSALKVSGFAVTPPNASRVGEYWPDTYIAFLDALDERDKELESIKAALRHFWDFNDFGFDLKDKHQCGAEGESFHNAAEVLCKAVEVPA